MNRRRIFFILLFIVFIVLLGFGAKTLILDRQNFHSALRVDAFPKADVYLNDSKVGQTPYVNENVTVGQYVVKLVAASGSMGSFVPWEEKVTLAAGGLTYVDRNLAASADQESGQTLWLSRLLSDNQAEVAVISDPDGANVTVDGLPKGTTSVLLPSIVSGDHEIRVSKQNYGDQIIYGKIVSGFRLNAYVKLGSISPGGVGAITTASSSATAISSATPSAKTLPKPYVVIQNTPTGFLNVRISPDLTATIAGKINPGDMYPLVSEQPGWVLLRQASSSANLGWASDQYVQIFK